MGSTAYPVNPEPGTRHSAGSFSGHRYRGISVEHKIKEPLPRPMRCDSCQSTRIKLEDNAILYRRSMGDWPLIWYCDACYASVGCHQGTVIPLGPMADRETRQARKRAHDEFDPIWRRGHLKRPEAYKWLANQLRIESRACHISWFNKEQCEAVITICQKARRKKYVPNHFKRARNSIGEY